MPRLLGLICFGGLALAAGLTESGNLLLAKRQAPACSASSEAFQVNNDLVTPNSPGSVDYTVRCRTDTLGDPLGSGFQAPNGYSDCITRCEATTYCQAFQFTPDSTGIGGNCYLKRSGCNQPVGFDRIGLQPEGYVAAVRPGPAGTPTGTSAGPSPSATRACAASPSQTAFAGDTYYVQCDIDTEGGLIDGVGGQTDYTACFPLCEQRADCIGFTFTRFDGSACPGYCYFKYGDGSGVRFTYDGQQGQDLVAAIRAEVYQAAETSTTVPTTATGGPDAYTSLTPSVIVPTTTISSATTSTGSVPTGSICPASNTTIFQDSSTNSYTVYCAMEYAGESILAPNVANFQACLDSCGTRVSNGLVCFGVTWNGGANGQAGPGNCYQKTTGLYLEQVTNPDLICAVRIQSSSTAVASTTLTATSSVTVLPSQYTTPVTTTTSSIAPPAASPYGPPGLCPGVDRTNVTDSTGQSYNVRCYGDISGTIDVTPATSARTENGYQGCLTLCSANANCNGFVFQSQNDAAGAISDGSGGGFCYFKGGNVAYNAQTSNRNVAYIKIASPPATSSPSTSSATTTSLVVETPVQYTTPPATTSSSPSASISSTTIMSVSSEQPQSPSAYTTPTLSTVSSISSSGTSSLSSSGVPSAYTTPTLSTVSSTSTSGTASLSSAGAPSSYDITSTTVSSVSSTIVSSTPSSSSQVATSSVSSSASEQTTFTVTPLPSSSPSPVSSSLVSSISAITSSVAPPAVTDIPQCAQPCVNALVDPNQPPVYGGCNANDVQCICSNQALLETYRTCVLQNCPGDEAIEVYDYALDLCSDYGVTALPALYPPGYTVTTSTTPSSTLSAGSTAPPAYTDLPSCAQSCVLVDPSRPPTYGGCADGAVSCICSNTPLLENYRTCILESCSAASANDVYSYAVNLCRRYGVNSLPPLYSTSIASTLLSTSSAVTGVVTPSYGITTTSSTMLSSSTSSATTVAIPRVTDIPTCAQSCVLNYGYCAEGDVGCICSNTPLLITYRSCVVNNCNTAGAYEVYSYAVELCGRYGVSSLPPLFPSSSTSSQQTAQSTSTSASRASSGTLSVTSLPGLSSAASCIPCTRSTGSCVLRTTVIPVRSREL